MKETISKWTRFWLTATGKRYTVFTQLWDDPLIVVEFIEGDIWGVDGWRDGPSLHYPVLSTFKCHTTFRAYDRTLEEVKSIIKANCSKIGKIVWVAEKSDVL